MQPSNIASVNITTASDTDKTSQYSGDLQLFLASEKTYSKASTDKNYHLFLDIKEKATTRITIKTDDGKTLEELEITTKSLGEAWLIYQDICTTEFKSPAQVLRSEPIRRELHDLLSNTINEKLESIGITPSDIAKEKARRKPEKSHQQNLIPSRYIVALMREEMFLHNQKVSFEI